MKSVKNVKWWRNITGGELNEAWISYRSSTKISSVVFTGIVDDGTVEKHFDSALDLRLYLPKEDKGKEKVKEVESFTAQLTEQEFETATGAKMMSSSEMVSATNNFDEKNKLGEGGFSAVYKGFLKSKYIAVKKFKRVSIHGLKYYASEVMITGKLKLENLIKLIDSNFNAKLADFGLSRLVSHDAKSLEGWTNGYEAPECHQTGKSSKMYDVYSFGVVALEIACGRRAFVQMDDGNHVRLVKWVWDYYEQGNLLMQLTKDYAENLLRIK
ncbi:hypothetical protein GH714_000390 [Hevea brasiliensis]|uniref:Protein kinase domain-containing protein n=1 Tax=Hevea brasiliensis TaxID=3981 RepID=A0A6A6N5U8_HEVBR|nr:hypothetical protein GH714_000390 [Hevea brasiliensis]